MSLRLILMRHAKSSWDAPELRDHDRPLNGRGQKSARAIGKWLTQNNYLPDQVLCSSSQRTRETWERLGLHAEVETFEALYHASEGEMLRLIRREARAPSVMVLGHNPGTAFLAHELVRKAPAHPKFALFPTAAVLVVEFDTDDWDEIGYREGRVLDFTVPREVLKAGEEP